MNKYELMYIIDVALEDEPRKELVDRVTNLITENGGEVEKTDEWGKRRLAYSIDYKNEGYYVLMNFTAPPELPKELERVLQINENVLRYLVIRLEEKHTSVKPRANPRPMYGRPPEPYAPEVDPADVVPVAAPVAPVAAAPVADAAPVAEAVPATEAPMADAAPVAEEAAPEAEA